MTKYLLPLCLLFSCAKENKTMSLPPDKPVEVQVPAAMQAAATNPVLDRPDHTVVVWLENKSYHQIIGSSSAPFINSLISKGTLFTNSYALFQPSYPNYIAWFSGSNWRVTSGACIDGQPYGATTLFHALHRAKRTFKWASEDLPAVGSRVCSKGYYREKHNPTTIFKTVPDSVNVPLSTINLTDTATFKRLPNVLVVTPNLMNDMHDGSIARGDAWLKKHFEKYIAWARKHNSVFMVYYDEDNGKEDNRIPVLAVGHHIKQGHKAAGKYNHYSFSKAVLAWNRADTAFHSHIKYAAGIRNIWQ